MEFREYVLQHLALHPAAQMQDVLKLCYQAAYGGEHLLSDPAAAKVWFDREFAQTPPRDILPCERIGPSVCRLNIAGWKAKALPGEWLWQLFLQTKPEEAAGERFRQYLAQAGQVLENKSQWEQFLDGYFAAGGGAVHHSGHYREKEQPAYRIAPGWAEQVLPVLEAAARNLREKGSFLIAIDGRAAAGKTTLASRLEKVLSAQVVHMDDFFLPPQLRTPQRLNQAGGNVHYERFLEEVLPGLRGGTVTHRIFNCGRMDYAGRRNLPPAPIRIVEGAYSCHEAFGGYWDMAVFMDIDAEKQLLRLRARNGEAMAQIFRDRWIPMEEQYIRTQQPELWQLRLRNDKGD